MKGNSQPTRPICAMAKEVSYLARTERGIRRQLLTAVYSAVLRVKLCIHTRRLRGGIWEQGWQIGGGAHDKFMLVDHSSPQSPRPEAGADTAKILSIFTWSARSARKRKQHEVFELAACNGAQQQRAPVLDGKNSQTLRKPDFRILYRQIGWKVVGRVAISQKVGIEANN
jgi:hypothetical protein